MFLFHKITGRYIGRSRFKQHSHSTVIKERKKYYTKEVVGVKYKWNMEHTSLPQ